MGKTTKALLLGDITPEQRKSFRNYYNVKRKARLFDRLGNQIKMRLTLAECEAIWFASGQYSNRGLKHGQYCLSRNDDLGHYQIDNCVVELSSENARRAKLGRAIRQDTRDRMTATRTGKPNGKKGTSHSMPAWNKGQEHTSDQVEKMSDAMQGHIYRKVICPHCGRDGGLNNMKRYHFQKCKYLPDEVRNVIYR